MQTINFDKLNINAGDTVLDIGCGEGRHSIGLYVDREVNAIGIDLSMEDMKTAKSRIEDFSITDTNTSSCVFGAGDIQSNPFGPFAKERTTSRGDNVSDQDLIEPCRLSEGEGEEQVGALVGFVGISKVLDQDISTDPGLVRAKVIELVRGVVPEPDQDLFFPGPVSEDSFIIRFFRVLFVVPDHECLGVSKFVQA